MGIYIPNMEMPVGGCKDCWLKSYCCHYQLGSYSNGKGNPCPLVPVPPHGRLIDAGVLFEEVYKAWGVEHDASDCNQLMGFINDAPTIIPAEKEETNGSKPDEHI